MDKGLCAAAVLMEDAFNYSPLRCGKLMLEDELTINNALPVAERYQAVMNWLLARLKAQGVYETLVREAKTEYWKGRNTCEDPNTQKEEGAEGSIGVQVIELRANTVAQINPMTCMIRICPARSYSRSSVWLEAVS